MVVKNFAENWIDIYNTYLDSINFAAGDFDTLKESIKDYIIKQTPEQMNDWAESSEAGLFVNAMAYLGSVQNYRVDLNVNDLFPTTTTRKQSLLNFTKMLSYANKRNICANGIAKVVAVSTTQDITDNSGNILKGVTVKWNDPTNEDWLEQFLIVLNSAFTYTNQFGKPTKSISIEKVSNQIYQFNNVMNSSCTFPFTAKINNNTKNFEVVNPDIDTSLKIIKELTPIPERRFQILYRNDGAGNNSINTGFFVYWKQGSLTNNVYNFTEKKENNIIYVDDNNINNDDVWFQEISADTGYTLKNWTKLPTNEYLSYTNTNNDIRTIYKVETDENDTIRVCFSDGFFGDMPYGLYRLWYRTSDGNSGLYIKPSDINNVSVTIPYYNNKNNSEANVYYLTLIFSIEDASYIRQSVATESLASIRENAPALYSTQNRMVSNRDYNYFPRNIGQQIRILNAIERTYAGNSRYMNLNDPTGLYSHVNLLATDGYIYNQTDNVNSSISIGSLTGEKIYEKYIEPLLSLKEISNLYYQNYDGEFIPENTQEAEEYYYWRPKMVKLGENTMVGGLYISLQLTSEPEYSDDYSDCASVLRDMTVGDMLCFQSFTVENNIEKDSQSDIIWARVEQISEYMGTVESLDELYEIPSPMIGQTYIVEKDDVKLYYNYNGSEWVQCDEIPMNCSFITISEILDTNKHWKIRKDSKHQKWSKFNKFTTVIDSETKNDIIEKLTNGDDETSFGLTYYPTDSSNGIIGRWKYIGNKEDEQAQLQNDDLEMVMYSSNDVHTQNGSEKVANWIIRIKYNSETKSWDIDSHQAKVIFGSAEQTSFFFNTSKKSTNSFGYFLTDDVIKVLKTQTNTSYNFMKDYYWKPYNVIKYSDGYVDTQRFLAESFDGDKDDVIDIPTQYSDMTEHLEKLIFIKTDDTTDIETQFLEYIDLYSAYNRKEVAETENIEKINQKEYEISMWDEQRLSKTGYYYSYHKINRIIPPQTLPDEQQYFWEPVAKNIILTNGDVVTWSGNKEQITGTNIKFVINDSYSGYHSVSEFQSQDQIELPLFYDDVLLADGTVGSQPQVTDLYMSKASLPTTILYDEGIIVKVYFDEDYDYETTFYRIKSVNGLKSYEYYGKELHGYLYYYNADTIKLQPMEEGTDYTIVDGLKNLTFLWKHFPTEDYLIDPCSTNIIDMYVLTNDYYTSVQEWIQNGKQDQFPRPPSAYELKSVFASLENNKMISDTIVWHPVNYKLIFGHNADTDTHCIFKIIKQNDLVSDNEVKKRVIQLIDKFFTYMTVGETFYFTQLSTYIENNIPSLIKTCVIVPTDTSSSFGSLFQIKCNDNEILLSSATLEDVQIISEITSQNIRSSS